MNVSRIILGRRVDDRGSDDGFECHVKHSVSAERALPSPPPPRLHRCAGGTGTWPGPSSSGWSCLSICATVKIRMAHFRHT